MVRDADVAVYSDAQLEALFEQLCGHYLDTTVYAHRVSFLAAQAQNHLRKLVDRLNDGCDGDAAGAVVYAELLTGLSNVRTASPLLSIYSLAVQIQGLPEVARRVIAACRQPGLSSSLSSSSLSSASSPSSSPPSPPLPPLPPTPAFDRASSTGGRGGALLAAVEAAAADGVEGAVAVRAALADLLSDYFWISAGPTEDLYLPRWGTTPNLALAAVCELVVGNVDVTALAEKAVDRSTVRKAEEVRADELALGGGVGGFHTRVAQWQTLLANGVFSFNVGVTPP